MQIGDNEMSEFEQFSAAISAVERTYDFIVIDTPGTDSYLMRLAHSMADTLVTPINDSFVDFDLIGQVDAETFKVRRLSFYAELIWEARKKRAMSTIREQRREMDWVVVRNRTGHVEARNQRRLNEALSADTRDVLIQGYVTLLREQKRQNMLLMALVALLAAGLLGLWLR